MDRQNQLNAAQREAVETLSGPVLILAGAGTGKTRVITHRMAELIRRGTPPERILSVTFTNKAAREMRERAVRLLGAGRKPHPHVSTFHSLCSHILRQEIWRLGYPAEFVILDRGDQESQARTALRDIRVAEEKLRPADLINIISRWKMVGVEPEAAAEAAQNPRDVLAATAYRRYQKNMKASASVDFDDLLLLTSRIFENFPEALSRWQARFDHVQIDEYQDTNGIQFDLVEALVRPHHNLCVVGDDDQSIYGWRGADLRHILGFAEAFPGTRVIRLQDNYRCTDQILQLANNLVRHNKSRHEKHLIPHKFASQSVRYLEFPDDIKEAEHVVREIQYLVNEQQVLPGDAAILFRTNEQPRVFETQLRKARLPYVVLGSMSFFDRREIRDLLAYLKVLWRPEDDISLLRIINVPARGIGATTTEKIMARAVLNRQKFWDASAEAAAAGAIPKKMADALVAFQQLLNRFRADCREHPQRLDEILSRLIEEIGYEAEIEKQYKEPPEQLMRMAVVEDLVKTLKDYCAQAAEPSLGGFLEEAALTGKDEQGDKDDKLAETGVKLMTLHSAKGLEFSRVYLVGMEEGLLPHKRSIDDMTTAAIDEERRLAYVGVTRAKDYLTITRAARRMKWGRTIFTQPSRFLNEMRAAHPTLETKDE